MGGGHSGIPRRLILAVVVSGASLAPTFAQQPTPEQIASIRQSCRSDFMAHCAGVQPGGRDALECLKRNAAGVSAACKTALDAVGPKPAAATAAPAAPPPPGANTSAPVGTRQTQPAEPAAAPAAAMPAAPAPSTPAPSQAKRQRSPEVTAVRAACRADFGVHCPGVKPGSAAALQCLQVNEAALSPACRNAVAAMGEHGAAPPATAAAPETPAAAPVPAVAPLGPIPPMRPRRALEILSLCGPERRALCAEVPPGGGRIIACLAENAQRLSPECYGALARASR